jgi:hypothetical protein
LHDRPSVEKEVNGLSTDSFIIVETVKKGKWRDEEIAANPGDFSKAPMQGVA